MSTVIATDRRANLQGSFWMVASMGAFSMEDVLVKSASRAIPIGQLLVLFGSGGAIVFACAALLNKNKSFTRDILSPPMRLRVGFEIMGRLFYVLAISLTPLSSATVILQATSIVVVAGAAVIFGERVGWIRWIAMFIGLAGVVVIVRPGAESFSSLSILAVIGMFGFAGRDLASRAAPSSIRIPTLGLIGFLSVVVAGAIYSLWNGADYVWPDSECSLRLAGAVILGVAAYSGLMKAMRTGEVSAVTPFRYSRMFFGITLGVFLFGERLDASILIGCGLIVVSGLCIIWKSRNRAPDS